MSGRISDLKLDKKRMHVKHNRRQNKHINEWKKTLRPGFIFKTGNGKLNIVTGFDGKTIFFKSEKSEEKQLEKNEQVKINKISLLEVKHSAHYVFYMGCVTRKELEKFNSFSSAILGLMIAIFGDSEVEASTLPNRTLILTVIGTRFFLSGMDRASKSDWSILKSLDVDTVLMTYFNIRDANEKVWLEHIKDTPIKILLDCGEFSRFKLEQKYRKKYKQGLISKDELDQLLRDIEIDVYKFAEFINKYKRYIHAYITLDKTGDYEQTRKNTDILRNLTGMDPIPVWHVNYKDWENSNWDELEKIVKESHKIIAIGATAHMYDEKKKRACFEKLISLYPKQNFHLLGYSSYCLIDLNIYSADSQGWINGRKANDDWTFQIYTFDHKYKSTHKIAAPIRPSKRRSELDIDERKKWDKALTSFKKQCISYNIKQFEILERHNEQTSLFGMTLDINLTDEELSILKNLEKNEGNHKKVFQLSIFD